MHDSKKKVDGVYMIESMLIDKQRGIVAPAGYGDLPDGSWFGSFYVENPQVWDEIKNGVYKGFSVEGMFEYDEPISAEENALRKINKLLNEIITD